MAASKNLFLKRKSTPPSSRVKFPAASTDPTTTLAKPLMGKKVTCIQYPRKAPHMYKKLGFVIVHDAQAEVSFHTFDFRYTGQRSHFGQYLRDLHAKGVDISDAVPQFVKVNNEELIIVLAKRLYKALVTRTVYKDGNSIRTTNDTAYDWTKPAAKLSRYYKMAEKLLQEHEEQAVIDIVNLITGFA